MRVLEAIQVLDLRLGGPCRAVLDLSTVLACRGHDVSVLAATAPDIPVEWFERSGEGVRRHPQAHVGTSFRWPFPPSDFLDLASRLVRTSEVVHLHGVWEPYNLMLSAVARRLGIPYVVTLRGMLDDWSMIKSRYKKRAYLALGGREMLEHAAFVQCTADAELRQSAKWFPGGTGRVVPNLLNLTPFSDDRVDGSAARARFPQLSKHSIILLFLGRVSPKKGVEHLIDAASRLVATGMNVCAVIAGDAPDRRYAAALQAQAVARGIASRVYFVGHVGGDLKVSLLRAAALTVVPTSQENFGFVFYESLAAGTPVVTTDLVDTADELARSGAGFIVKQSGEAIAACVGRVLASPYELKAAGQRGRTWVFNELATARVAEKYEQMFGEAIASANRKRA